MSNKIFFGLLPTFIPIFAFVVMSIAPVIASAQALEAFSVSASPEYPKAGTQVTISINSFSTDLNRAKITWRENNIVVAQDIGIKEKTFISPANGATKNISIEAITSNGYKLTGQYTLTPQAIDLLWEATDSYVPPFYRGKALVGEQGLVRITAIPNFTQKSILQDRSQTVYTWTRNTTQPENVSGYGKNSFAFRLNPLKSSEKIKVLAGALSGSSQVEESLLIRPAATQIVLYETSPLLGTIFGQAFTTGLRLITDELTLVAEPYYFSGSSDLRSKNTFTWSVGGRSTKTGVDPMRLTLRRPEGAGQTDIGITVSHLEKTLQSAKNQIKIVYDDK